MGFSATVPAKFASLRLPTKFGTFLNLGLYIRRQTKALQFFLGTASPASHVTSKTTANSIRYMGTGQYIEYNSGS